MDERHEAQLKLAHQLYDNRDLKQELLWQREFLDTGYLSYQQVCFNKWIFDECLKQLGERKIGKWIYDKKSQNWRCSVCNETPKTIGYVGTADFMAEHFKFCNHCGAEMVGAENG